MNPHDQASFDPRVADWLEDDPNHAPDQALEIVLAALPSIKQRRAWRVPWRFTMTTLPKLAIGAAAVLAIVIGGAFFLRPGSSDLGAGGGPAATSTPIATTSPSPSPSQTASPTPSPDSLDTATWVPFSSSRYAYSMKHPASWTTSPSTRAWTLATDRTDWLTTASDGFHAGDGTVYFSVFAAPIPAGTTAAQWIATYHGQANPCPETPLDIGTTSVGGHAATMTVESSGIPDCGGDHAYVQIGSKMYVFSVWLDQREGLFKAFVSTVVFQ